MKRARTSIRRVPRSSSALGGLGAAADHQAAAPGHIQSHLKLRVELRAVTLPCHGFSHQGDHSAPRRPRTGAAAARAPARSPALPGQAEPQEPLTGSVHELSELCVQPLAHKTDAALWREYVDRYHYLGYTPLAGAQLRYLVRSGQQVFSRAGVCRLRLEGGSP